MARSNLEKFAFEVTYHPKRKQAWQCIADGVHVWDPLKTFKGDSAEKVLRAAIDWADGVM